MMWVQLGFSHGNIFNFDFSDKKIKFQKFCPCGFLWPQSVNKVLTFCSWYGL